MPAIVANQTASLKFSLPIMSAINLSKLLPKILLCIFLPTALSLSAFGDIFRGTITETVTTTDDPRFFVGQTFVGSYEYESPTCDGDFGSLQYCFFADHPGALPTLQFSIFSFLGSEPNGWMSLAETNFQVKTHLVVTDGAVTDFYLTSQLGAADPNFRLSIFYVPNAMALIDGHVQSTNTTGTMSFSAPTVVQVPDGATPTVALLALSLLGFAVLHRSLKKHPV